jgi:hypothetical protein
VRNREKEVQKSTMAEIHKKLYKGKYEYVRKTKKIKQER